MVDQVLLWAVGAYPARERLLKVLPDSLILVEVQAVLHKLNPVLGLLFLLILMLLTAQAYPHPQGILSM